MNLAPLNNQTILFLGKPRAFSEEEFAAQIEAHNISTTKELDDRVIYVLEGRMMTPYEQNLSDELYEKGGYTFLTIDDFEKTLAQEIDDDVLLMSLKLSNDKERLKSFLQNSCVSNALFFKLLQMYKWSGEDFFENDDNRDVTAALIGRFYENIERNHNVQYATTGVIHLVSQTQNPELLEAISNLEPLKFHFNLSILLARHPQTPKKVLKRLLREGEKHVLEAMCTNSALDMSIIKELVQEELYAKILAQKVKLTEESFELFKAFAKELAQNESLDERMQRALLALADSTVMNELAQNAALTQESIEKLMQYDESKLTQLLLENPNIDEKYLREAYTKSQNHLSLAKNPSLPEDLATALFDSAEGVVLEALARNEATPVDILYQLQLDSRFERAVKTNAAFTKHIQSQNIGWLV
ncbi:hypothetical protein [Sulfurimonas sp. NWX79]|uniref:hypothetical protein n=1 Tax=Sulfurimonas sp. NWX79 TaxID=2925412 RepID=UPI003204BDC8